MRLQKKRTRRLVDQRVEALFMSGRRIRENPRAQSHLFASQYRVTTVELLSELKMPPLDNCDTSSQATCSCVNKQHNQPISSFQTVTIGKKPNGIQIV